MFNLFLNRRMLLRPKFQDFKKKSISSMLHRLKEAQLESLVRAVETGGQEPGQCCPVPVQGRDVSPHVVMCHVFRWRHLVTSEDQLVRLPLCSSDSDHIYTCCNPYHWSRVIHSGNTKYFEYQFYPPQDVLKCHFLKNKYLLGLFLDISNCLS